MYVYETKFDNRNLLIKVNNSMIRMAMSIAMHRISVITDTALYYEVNLIN